MLLSNEAELLAMEADKYSGVNPIVVDNNNLTIGLDSGFIEAVSSISGAISGLDNKLDISAFTGYSAALDSGLSNAFETVHNDITELQGDDSYLSGSIDYLSGVVTTGLSAYSAGPNINITDYVISGKDWLDTIQEASAYAAQQNPTSSTEWNSTYETVQSNSATWASETFTGVSTDSTLTGNGKETPLGVAEVQSLTSDNTINITSANNEVILGVNGTWFNEAVNSAVTGAQGDVEVNTYVHNNSATIDVVNTTVQSYSGKWNDTYTTYSNNSASYLTDASQFYPMNSNPSGYLTEETDWTNTIKEASANAFNEATALIPPAFDPTFMSGAIDNKLDATAFSTVSGDFATTGDLQNYATTSWVSNINTAIRNDMGTIAANTANNYSAITSTSSFLSGAVDNKLDTTAFGDVSGTFLTSHQSLDGYATTAWVDSQGYLTAHQPISADEWNNVYDTVNVYSGSWTGSESSPTASVDSNGSIDIVSSNNTVYFDVNGTWFNDAVNSAVDVPTGVMVESACEYNAVNEISGYNGSAIAQYGAEKQWLVHDDTLVHAANSAQYALGCNISALQRLMGIDETVLFVTASYNNNLSSIPLSEPLTAFDRVRIYDIKNHVYEHSMFDTTLSQFMLSHDTTGNYWRTYWNINTATYSQITYNTGWLGNVTNGCPYSAGANGIPVGAPYGRFNHPWKIVGVGRKEV